ncbi:MAG: hypothetical protein GX297_04675 [Treponema sp.]|jgi:hypothetical protein|nr:hypothetical protein [Treponema sp.]
MIEMTSGILSTYSYSYASTHNTGGKIAVPVKPSMVIYSQLEHISGYADPKATNGITLNKVHLLNTLIDKVTSAKSGVTEKINIEALSEAELDNLISDYQAKLQTQINIAKDNPYAVPLLELTGSAVNLVA